jgi:hypothetical protein
MAISVERRNDHDFPRQFASFQTKLELSRTLIDSSMPSSSVPRIELTANTSLLRLDQNGLLQFSLQGQLEWQNSGPLFLLHYYDRQHPRAQTVAAPSNGGYVFGTAGTPSLSAKGHLSLCTASGAEIMVTASFEGIGVEINVRVMMAPDGTGFGICIEDAGIVEDNPSLYRILSIELLPEFGAATTGEKGYLTLPNWSGCQTFFDKSYPREVRQTVYSSNDQWEHNCNMPVFGITRSQGTLCGLIAQGDYDAQLASRVHWEKQQANSIHPCLVYRWQQEDERLTGVREVRYSFAPPDYHYGEGYVFCGRTYREFLRRERGLLTWEEKARTRPVALEYRDRFFLKIFMAYKDPRPDGLGDYHSACTFAEAKEILDQCLARGMKKLTAILVGWGQDGHDGMPPTRFPVDKRLGGEAEMRKLITWCRENDIMIGVHDSYGGAYTCSPEFNVDELIRHRTGEYWESIVWSGGQCHILCPCIYVDKHVKRDIPAIRALGIHGHHHIDCVGSFMTCFSKDHPLEKRADYVQEVRRMFQFVTDEIGSVSTEMPFGPYFDVIDGIFHSFCDPFSFHRASAVGRYFLDRSIPLLSIALHGSISLFESLEENPLLGIDWGLSPRAEVSYRSSLQWGIPDYASAAEKLAACYRQFYGEKNPLSRMPAISIDGRWEIAPGVTRTLYSDGTVVRVNRTHTPYDGVPPHDYIVEPSAVPS